MQTTFITPEKIIWTPNPALPAGSQEAIIHGDPSEHEDYIIRVRVPAGTRVLPHTHPEGRVYTVLSGEFMIGIGNLFKKEELQLLPPGSVIFLPGGAPHFQYSEKEEYVIQIQGRGPVATDYIDQKDDPRH